MSCEEDIILSVNNPANYTFTRNGQTTVAFSEGTTNIAMAEELITALLDETNTEESLKAMFSHIEGVEDFSNTSLNTSSNNIRNNVASSIDYYFLNNLDTTTIREDFDGWLTEQVTTVFPSYSIVASAGVAGQLEDVEGNTTRYVNTKGIELNEFFSKGLIGGIMMDQILNNYLSSSVLDADNNIQDNDDDVLVAGKNYTAMEHSWDEAYGYLFGAEIDPSNPSFGADSFLSEYINQADQDTDFTGIAEDIYSAFKLGRAAIVAKDYDVREEQTEIIKEKISQAIAIVAVQRFLYSTDLLEMDTINYGTAFHNISEGLGLLYTLQFSREPNTTDSPTPYLTKFEIELLVSSFLDTGNGLWEVSTTLIELEDVIEDIESAFGYEDEELVALLTN